LGIIDYMEYLNYLRKLSDEELKIAGREIRQLHETAILPDGHVKKLTQLITKDLPGADLGGLNLAITMVNEEILLRFINS